MSEVVQWAVGEGLPTAGAVILSVLFFVSERHSKIAKDSATMGGAWREITATLNTHLESARQESESARRECGELRGVLEGVVQRMSDLETAHRVAQDRVNELEARLEDAARYIAELHRAWPAASTPPSPPSTLKTHLQIGRNRS